MYQPTHLKLWKRPPNYFGESWPDWYVFLWQNRDSDALERSNFEVALTRLGKGIDGENSIRVIRESHWACGWVEWIGIHQSDSKALEAADRMLEDLAYYPILDESHFSELEWNEASDYWESLSLSGRVGLCKDVGVSIFAARHSLGDLPDRLFEALRD